MEIGWQRNVEKEQVEKEGASGWRWVKQFMEGREDGMGGN